MKVKITESQNKLLQEKLMLKNWKEYIDLVADAYEKAPDYDPSVLSHWEALNKSNYEWFRKITKLTNVIFVSGDKKYENNPSSINILGKNYSLIYYQGGQPYSNQSEMKQDYEKNHRLYISIDYSEHPFFSVIDNIVFRTVHDLVVHLMGNYSFETGEINSYNLHARLAPPSAVPALFTEVVGQAATVLSRGGFPKQKIAVLKGFDYYKVGMVDDYEIKDKKLIKKDKEMRLSEELLDEGKQVGILAHYTTFNNVIKIIKTNIMESDRGYISFTRNLIHSKLKEFGNCRIIIDGDKLSNKYKVQPFMFNFDDEENGFNLKTHKERAKKLTQDIIRNDFAINQEREEIVVGKITNIRDYIIQVEYPAEMSQWRSILKDIGELQNQYNIKFIPNKNLDNGDWDEEKGIYGKEYLGRPNLNENKIMKIKKIKITESQLNRLLENNLKECNCDKEIDEAVNPNQEGDVIIPNNNANVQTIKNYTDQGINVKLVDNNGLPTA